MNKNLKTLLLVAGIFFLWSVFLWGLGDALLPLLISFCLSYLLFPVVKKLEIKGIKRHYGVLGIFLAILLIMMLSLALILPKLFLDLQIFFKELPHNSWRALEKMQEFFSRLGYPLDLGRDTLVNYLRENLSEFSSGILKALSKGLSSSFSGFLDWLIAFLNLFLIPLFFFYVINDYEKILAEIKSFIPKSMIGKLTHYMNLGNEVLRGYIRGQFLVALSLSFLYALGLSLVGLRFGVLIGLISGLISMIPYAGFVLGFGAAIIMALANYTGFGLLVGITVVFISVQILEGILITPKLVGNKVGLSALATILALIIGGNLLGLLGMLIAIPLAAMGKAVVLDLKREYQKLDFYKSSHPPAQPYNQENNQEKSDV